MIDLPIYSLLDHTDDLHGKVILITGGAAGFGQGAAQLAAKHGAKVVIADLKLSMTRKAVAEITKAGGTCSAPDEPVDVTKPDSIRAAFDHCLKAYGRVPDAVFANAGVNLNDHFEEDGEIGRSGQPSYPRPTRNITLAVNLTGVLNTCEITQEYWRKHPVQKGQGRSRRLVILSSMGGTTGIPGATAYSTSKHAVLGYWKSLVQELEKRGPSADFECYALCPFFAKTKIFATSTLIVLSGLPLVPVPVIVQSLLYIASKPVDVAKPPGGVVILPDDGDPAMATASEYDSQSLKWSQMMDEKCARTDDRTGWLKVRPSKRVWRDIARNLFETSPTGLVIRLILLIGVLAVGVWASIIGLRLMPTWLNVVLGVALGFMPRFRGAKTK